MFQRANTTVSFARQGLAWLAAIAVCLNPLVVSGSPCGCNRTSDQAVANCPTPSDGSCCSREKGPESVPSSCCSSGKSGTATPTVSVRSTECKCGDKCRCSSDENRIPVPAVPVTTTSTQDSLSVALPVQSGIADPLVRVDNPIRYGRWLCYPPELSALETCALLSRFVC